MKRTVRTVMFAIALLAVSSVPSLVGLEDQTILNNDIRVVDFDELRYPPIARASRVQGVVVIKLKLDDQGKVTDAVAISGAAALVVDCLENAKKWRFQRNAHKSAVIAYDFRMPGGECKSTSSLFMFKRPNLAVITGCDVPANTAQ